MNEKSLYFLPFFLLYALHGVAMEGGNEIIVHLMQEQQKYELALKKEKNIDNKLSLWIALLKNSGKLELASEGNITDDIYCRIKHSENLFMTYNKRFKELSKECQKVQKTNSDNLLRIERLEKQAEQLHKLAAGETVNYEEIEA